ncbi:MAG: hypothetical protein J6S83_12235 [Lachnospiraceae bacterium]|nr:hypothetical protein [Lachnospiraceae bacterium]
MKKNSAVSVNRSTIIVFLMIALIHVSAAVPVFAEETSGTGAVQAVTESQLSEAYDQNNNASMPVTFTDESQLGEVRQIRLPFPALTEEKIEWDFPYSDEFFDLPAEEFSITMARGSMGLTLSAFRSESGPLPPQYETYLTKAGFTDIYSFGYDEPPRADSLSGVIGMKRIGDSTVIATAACGQGYGSEWASNFKVGNGERHEGFSQAAGLFEDHLLQYLKDNGIEGKKILWVSGFSRASAVGNILAANMIESGKFDNVYAYLFGVPRTTKQPVRYKGIYNICGQYDPVPSVPLQCWGYERYGTDLYTPAQESDVDYSQFALSANEVGLKLDGKKFRNNPEVNYQLRLILESFGEFFPDSEDYCRKLQDLLTEAVTSLGDAHVFDLLTTAFDRLKPENSQDKAKIDIFTDYLGYIVAQHMRADQRQVDEGSWDPDEPLAANLAVEHLPVTYVRWLFSEEDPQEIFAGSHISRRISVIGTVGVTVLKDGQEITSIDKSGSISYPLQESSGETTRGRGVFMMRNENVTVISLPNNAEYTVRIDADKTRTVTFYNLIITPEKLATSAGKIVLARMSAGSYGFTVAPDEEIPPSPDEKTGRYTLLGTSEYDYSPIAVMNDELEATKHYFMSLRRVYQLVFNVVVGLVLFLLGCLIVHLVHRHQVKKGHPPFSKWFVIMPYLTVIGGLLVLTGMVTYHMFAIDTVRIVCASFTVLTIFLLSLRGTLRYPRKSSILLTTYLFALFAVTFMYFNRKEQIPFSWVRMTVFAIAVALLSAAAVLTFREPSKKKP